MNSNPLRKTRLDNLLECYNLILAYHVWNINYEVDWIKDAFPEDVLLLLINEDNDIEEIGTDDESDSDED